MSRRLNLDGWLVHVAAEAIAYDDHGIPLDQAIAWHAQGFEAAEAICFYDRRYTPEQALTVINLTTDEEGVEWLATGLAADRVIAYLRAGVTLDEYGDWENSDDSTDEALTMHRITPSALSHSTGGDMSGHHAQGAPVVMMSTGAPRWGQAAAISIQPRRRDSW
ncbi:MAG TPA: hypothetical protein VFJ09_08445 [Nocardioidaceae bacterium]|nr:hypothetical protein [Nocardioidaceae bacterium]